AALMSVNPIATFVMCVEGFMYSRMVAFAGPWFFPATFVVPSLWSFFLIWRAVRRVRAEPIPFRIRIPLVGRLWPLIWRQIGRLLRALASPFTLWGRISVVPRVQ